MTNRRVNVTLTFATEASGPDVLVEVLNLVKGFDSDLCPIEAASVHAFELDDEDGER